MPPIDDEIEDILHQKDQPSQSSKPLTGEVIPPPHSVSRSGPQPSTDRLPSPPPSEIGRTGPFNLFSDPRDLDHIDAQKDRRRHAEEVAYLEQLTPALAIHNARQAKWGVSQLASMAGDTPPNTLLRKAMIDLAAGLAPILVANAIDSTQHFRETQIARLNNRWSR